MPCFNDEDLAGLQSDFSRATTAACEALALLERHHLAGQLSAETQQWWDLHKRQDAQRQQDAAIEARRRALEQQALAKLTPEEREALGRTPG